MNTDALTRSEFDAHLANKTLRIAFVGMSNVGKSYRSKVLRDESGFDWYQVDKEIIKTLGFEGMEEIAAWLGLPITDTYQERERIYLDSEAKHTKVDFIDTDRNLVFDTTGSVIYLEKPTTEWLQENCLIVNLEAGEEYIDTMIQKFLEKPKPVVWNGMFVQDRGETQKETLERCFPVLMRDRLKKYRTMSHLNISADDLFDRSGPDTLAIIRSALAA